MPRSPRIEYENAIYHVLARGDRHEPIVFDDVDREMFVATLEHACAKTGWEVFAWVLMDNHYHLAVRTPRANLVSGMTWFQNTFTRRINVRHRLWGHLFGGRYKAILVEDESLSSDGRWSDYLMTLIDYIHLNPVRAGIIDGVEKSILDYPWSSLRSGYATPPTKRPAWLAIHDGLRLFQESDTTRSRKRFVERLDQVARSEGRETAGIAERDGQTMNSSLKRGWYWGSQSFKERVLEKFGTSVIAGKGRDIKSSQLSRDFGEQDANRVLESAMSHFKSEESDWAKTKRGDLIRPAVAWRLWRETSVSQQWICDQLSLKSRANVSQTIRRFESLDRTKIPKVIRQWLKLKIVG